MCRGVILNLPVNVRTFSSITYVSLNLTLVWIHFSPSIRFFRSRASAQSLCGTHKDSFTTLEPSTLSRYAHGMHARARTCTHVRTYPRRMHSRVTACARTRTRVRSFYLVSETVRCSFSFLSFPMGQCELVLGEGRRILSKMRPRTHR